jgi:hypothetical protein
VRHYCPVRERAAWYGNFRTRGLQYRLYHGWCITTVSSACTTPIHAAWYGSFRTPGLQYSSTVRTTISLVRQTTAPFACTPVHAAWYNSFGASNLRILVPYYRVHLHVACCCYSSLSEPTVQYRVICTMMVRQFNINQFIDMVVSRSFFANSTLSPLPSSNFLVFLPFPLSFSLYPCLAPSHSW